MSDEKSRMYNSKPKKAASKVITMAGQDHQVLSPEEFMRFRGEFSRMQSDIAHMNTEMAKTRNYVRQQDQKISLLEAEIRRLQGELRHLENTNPFGGLGGV